MYLNRNKGCSYFWATTIVEWTFFIKLGEYFCLMETSRILRSHFSTLAYITFIVFRRQAFMIWGQNRNCPQTVLETLLLFQILVCIPFCSYRLLKIDVMLVVIKILNFETRQFYSFIHSWMIVWDFCLVTQSFEKGLVYIVLFVWKDFHCHHYATRNNIEFKKKIES